jgi:hypothetical protein
MAADPTVPAQVYNNNNWQTGRHTLVIYTNFTPSVPHSTALGVNGPLGRFEGE